MVTRALGVSLVVGTLLGWCLSPSFAQATGDDKIIFRDAAKGEKVCRVIKETFRGVEYLVSGQRQPPLPLDEVRRVEYAGDPWGPVQSQIDNSEYARALSDIDRLTKDPYADKKWRDQYCLFYAGYCLERLQKLKEAIQKYEECRKTVSDTRFMKDTYLNSINCYQLMGDGAGVEKTLKAFEEESRTQGMWEADVDGLRATNYESRGQWESALAIHRKNKAARDADAADRAKAGELRCLLQLGRDSEAGRLAVAIIGAKNSSNVALAAAFAAQGADLLKQGQYEESLRSLLRVVYGVEPKREPIMGTFEFEFSSYCSIKALVELSLKESSPEKKQQMQNKAAEILINIRNPRFREMSQKELERK